VYYLTWLVARTVLYGEKRTAEVGATSIDGEGYGRYAAVGTWAMEGIIPNVR